MNKNDPAFHIGRDKEYPKDSEAGRPKPGLTARQYAAIHLCIPDSGVDWLDAMILRKQRDDLAARAMQGMLHDASAYDNKRLCCGEDYAVIAYDIADSMIERGDPDFAEVKKSGA